MMMKGSSIFLPYFCYIYKVFTNNIMRVKLSCLMLLYTCRLQILVMRGGQVMMTFLLSVEGKILTDDCLGLDSS